MNPFLKNVVTLTALAAVVDGSADDEEKELIVDRLAHKLEVSPDLVHEELDQAIGNVQDAANNPTLALNLAYKALRTLPFHQQTFAFDVAREVIDVNGVEPDESTFIWALFRLVFPESSGGT